MSNNIDINKSTNTKKINILPIINKKNIKQVLLFSLVLITILLQIVIKIWTFILLINYYNILNDNIKLDDTIVYNDYKYIYYLAIANIIFKSLTQINIYIYIYIKKKR